MAGLFRPARQFFPFSSPTVERSVHTYICVSYRIVYSICMSAHIQDIWTSVSLSVCMECVHTRRGMGGGGVSLSVSAQGGGGEQADI